MLLLLLLLCVCNDPSFMESAIDLAKRKASLKLLERTSHAWLPHVSETRVLLSGNDLGRLLRTQRFRNKHRKTIE
jgi:hypothetical protein